LLLAGVALSTQMSSGDWSPAAGPLLSRFAKDVSGQNPLPEYPRPQMVRPRWQNLNGLWDYVITRKRETKPSAFSGKILVPFPIESALSGVMKPVDERSLLWYRRTFEIPSDWTGQRLLLHFGAVDWEATVFINGRKIGAHRGGYDPFEFDITHALRASGPQEIVVRVFDPTEAGQPRGKQVRRPSGIYYTSITGIWQTVWIEPVPAVRIESFKITPDLDSSTLKLTVKTSNGSVDTMVDAVALEQDKEISRASGRSGTELVLPIPDVKTWSPDFPFLYGLKVSLKSAGEIIDSIQSYFGMRKISLGHDSQGVLRILLNNDFVFQMGPLDQGYWPDGLYTAPTDEALRYDLEMTQKFGFNTTRKHIKIEPQRWYYWCDRMGLLVWQDMPSGGNETPTHRQQFEKELRAMIEHLGNHPSIIMWVVFNEAWGQTRSQRWPKSMVKLAMQLDPTRLVNNASGWTDMKLGHVHDIHKYPGPECPAPEPDRALVLGEFGGLGLKIDGHTWTAQTWGYRGVADNDALTRQYQELLARTHELKESSGLSAAIYTQITDVETECNGLLTYDRQIIKADVDAIAAANRGMNSQTISLPQNSRAT
jgi:beta-galactosidase/beta-glucuronidase